MISTLFHLQILASLLLFWTRHVQTHSSPSYKLTDKLSPRLLDSSDSVNASEPALSHSSDGFDLRKRQACITLGCGIGSECYDVCGCCPIPDKCYTILTGPNAGRSGCYLIPPGIVVATESDSTTILSATTAPPSTPTVTAVTTAYYTIYYTWYYISYYHDATTLRSTTVYTSSALSFLATNAAAATSSFTRYTATYVPPTPVAATTALAATLTPTSTSTSTSTPVPVPPVTATSTATTSAAVASTSSTSTTSATATSTATSSTTSLPSATSSAASPPSAASSATSQAAPLIPSVTQYIPGAEGGAVVSSRGNVLMVGVVAVAALVFGVVL